MRRGRHGSAEKHIEGLKKLRAWYDEWSEIARVTIKRRDYLIQLGLAKRKSPTVVDTTPATGKSPSTPTDAGA